MKWDVFWESNLIVFEFCNRKRVILKSMPDNAQVSWRKSEGSEAWCTLFSGGCRGCTTGCTIGCTTDTLFPRGCTTFSARWYSPQSNMWCTLTPYFLKTSVVIIYNTGGVKTCIFALFWHVLNPPDRSFWILGPRVHHGTQFIPVTHLVIHRWATISVADQKGKLLTDKSRFINRIRRIR